MNIKHELLPHLFGDGRDLVGLVELDAWARSRTPKVRKEKARHWLGLIRWIQHDPKRAELPVPSLLQQLNDEVEQAFDIGDQSANRLAGMLTYITSVLALRSPPRNLQFAECEFDSEICLKFRCNSSIWLLGLLRLYDLKFEYSSDFRHWLQRCPLRNSMSVSRVCEELVREVRANRSKRNYLPWKDDTAHQLLSAICSELLILQYPELSLMTSAGASQSSNSTLATRVVKR